MVRNVFSYLIRCLTVVIFVYVYIICSIIHFSTRTIINPADCAIVFGSAVHGVSYPGPGIERRVSAATELYHLGFTDFLIMSGGVGRQNQQSEAQVMQRVAQRSKVPLWNIAIENQATSTRENIVFTTPIVASNHCTTIALVSDPYHLARIALLMRLYTPGVPYQLHGTTQPIQPSFYLSNILRESLAIPYIAIEWLFS
jgi:uncharacterized SAM-binding protein YcdF (DUF218 family)